MTFPSIVAIFQAFVDFKVENLSCRHHNDIIFVQLRHFSINRHIIKILFIYF